MIVGDSYSDPNSNTYVEGRTLFDRVARRSHHVRLQPADAVAARGEPVGGCRRRGDDQQADRTTEEQHRDGWSSHGASRFVMDAAGVPRARRLRVLPYSGVVGHRTTGLWARQVREKRPDLSGPRALPEHRDARDRATR